MISPKGIAESKIGKISSPHISSVKEQSESKANAKRSLSLSGKIDSQVFEQASEKIDRNRIKIMQLEATLIKQKHQKLKLLQENSKNKEKADRLKEKEQKIIKKQNLYNLVGNCDENRQKTLKKQSEELSQICESFMKTIEKPPKPTKNPTDPYTNLTHPPIISELSKDSQKNKELFRIFQVLKCKLELAKAKCSIKKHLKLKQAEQIKSMEKLVHSLINNCESLDESRANSTLSSLNMNIFNKTSILEIPDFNESRASLCDQNAYLKEKNIALSQKVIREKQNLELYQSILKKNQENRGNKEEMIIVKKISQVLVNNISPERENNIVEVGKLQKELLLKQAKLANLQGMLKFWIQEYANLSDPFDEF